MARGAVAWPAQDPYIDRQAVQGVICNSSQPIRLGAEVFSMLEHTGFSKMIQRLSDVQMWDDLDGPGVPDKPLAFNPFRDPLFMEWVYMLRPDKKQVEVWLGVPVCTGLRPFCRQNNYELSGIKKEYVSFTYTHIRIASVHEATGPNLLELDALGNNVAEAVDELDSAQ